MFPYSTAEMGTMSQINFLIAYSLYISCLAVAKHAIS